MKKFDFEKAKKIFLQKAGKSYQKIPSQEYSSARMGGWIIRDVEDMYIGFVGYRGDTQVFDYMPQTAETVQDNRFFKNKKC